MKNSPKRLARIDSEGFGFRPVILIALLFALAVCSSCTTLARIIDRIPDGETCLTLETETKIVSICVTKKSELKNQPEKKPADNDSNCIVPLCYVYQDPVDLPVTPQQISLLERLIEKLGFPVVVCSFLLFLHYKFMKEISVSLQKIETILKQLVRRE